MFLVLLLLAGCDSPPVKEAKIRVVVSIGSGHAKLSGSYIFFFDDTLSQKVLPIYNAYITTRKLFSWYETTYASSEAPTEKPSAMDTEAATLTQIEATAAEQLNTLFASVACHSGYLCLFYNNDKSSARR